MCLLLFGCVLCNCKNLRNILAWNPIENHAASAQKLVVSNRKKNIPLNTYVSFDMPAYPDEDNETRLVDILKPESEQNPEKLFIDREYSDSFKKKLFDRLSSFEKQVLQLYMEDNDYRQIAMLLGKTPKSIDNAIQRIRAKANSIS